MEVFFTIWYFLLGLVFGSFYNVVIYRLPRGLPIVSPRSACPSCGQKLGCFELIPLFSYLFLRGKCAVCGASISFRYFLVELICGLSFVLLFHWTASSTSFFVGICFFSLLLILALIDLEHKILPNALTLPGIGLGLLFALIGWSIPFWQSALGAIVGFLVFFLIALTFKGGMGMGDVKLMAMIGSFLGWQAVFYALALGSLFGSISGIIYLYLTKQDWKTPIPFGPSLALAAFILYFFL